VDEAEFQAILEHDQSHWWYRGRRRIVVQEIERLGLPPGARILDAGCGSGRMLDELVRFGDVSAIDLNPRGVAAARARGHAGVMQGRIEDLPFPDQKFDLVTCLDVLEHTADDVHTLRELLRVTRRGGYLLVTVPAYPALWSAHDEVNGHYRRYRRRALRESAERAGWRLARDTHFNSLLLAPAAVVRLAGRIRRSGSLSPVRSELSLTPPALDPVLELPLRVEAGLLGLGLRLPVGLSVAALFVRPAAVRLRAVRPPPPRGAEAPMAARGA
jgi:SAM-dependent methyltransferase